MIISIPDNSLSSPISELSNLFSADIEFISAEIIIGSFSLEYLKVPSISLTSLGGATVDADHICSPLESMLIFVLFLFDDLLLILTRTADGLWPRQPDAIVTGIAILATSFLLPTSIISNDTPSDIYFLCGIVATPTYHLPVPPTHRLCYGARTDGLRRNGI